MNLGEKGKREKGEMNPGKFKTLFKVSEMFSTSDELGRLF
jgi:hypothetical protein